MEMTHLVKSRGTCPRRQVGAVVVKDKRVLTTGYNGAPRNFPHPTESGCIRDELGIPSGMMADVCPCLHAEQNAILQAATTGVSIEGADLFCTTQPCTQCSRMIANCGMKRVVFEHEYADPLSIGLLVTAGVELWKWDAATRCAHRYGQSNTFAQAQEALRKKWQEGSFEATAPRRKVEAELREELHMEIQEPPGRPSESQAPGATGPAGDAPPADAAATGGEAGTRDGAHADGPPRTRGIRDLSKEADAAQKIRELTAERVRRDKQRRMEAGEKVPGDDAP